jgi:serine/threonine protein kinase
LDTHRITQDLGPEANKGNTQQLQTGTALANRYLIQDVIGVGGMGAVYRSRDLHFPNVVKLVAVKEMINHAPDPLVRRTIVRNFEREANLLATLDHRAIPRIYDYFTINERSYLVLEFVNGKDLEAILNASDSFLDEARVIGWTIELCDVLEYLHAHKPDPIIFRDIKPSNIMINLQDHVVLVDFGIAKHFQAGQRGTMIGTEGYSPPEQYRGEASPTADIYALGATLHHVFTRRDPRIEPPFSFSERPIRKLNPQVSPELETIVNQALQYTPADRFSSASEMREALLTAANKTGLLAGIPTPVTISAKAQAGEGVKPIWTFQCEDEVRGSPCVAGGMVYVGSYDNNLYALSTSRGEFQWKYPTDSGVVSRPVVYEGNVYFGSTDHRLHVVTARTGKINWTYYTKGPIHSSPHIAEGHAFIGSDDGRLHAVNTITGRQAWQMDAGAPVRSTPIVEHDLVYFGVESGEFICLDFAGAAKWRFRAKRGVTGSAVVNNGVVYFGSLDSTLYALDARTGWVIWRFRLGRGSISTPSLADNLLFTGAADGCVYCIEAATSKEVWKFTAGHQVTGSPLIYKDSLYIGSVDGYIYCLEYRTGRLRWKFKTEGPVTGTPVAADDSIFIGSTDRKVYALMA